MTLIKNPGAWKKAAVAIGLLSGVAIGGRKLSTDSPVHFAVVGQAPVQADGWECAPEGGLIGAPLVCRPRPEIIAPVNTETKTAQ